MSKVLALCVAGTVRSGGLVLAAKRRGLDAVQAGVDYNTPETIAYLTRWADVVFVAEPWMIDRVPKRDRRKCVDSGLGPDRWLNPLHPDLEPLCDRVINDWLMRPIGT